MYLFIYFETNTIKVKNVPKTSILLFFTFIILKQKV